VRIVSVIPMHASLYPAKSFLGVSRLTARPPTKDAKVLDG